MAIMKEHIDVTQSILEGRIHEDVIRIACRHHEKLDGSGYPLCLEAGQLTLSDRIVAAADIISALAGKRSYKESFSRETVIEILNQQKDGGKLCGSVIDLAINNYDTIMQSAGEKIKFITELYDRINKEFNFIKKRMEELNERTVIHTRRLEPRYLYSHGC
jgi:HD-GYP domain-containing protein (c-di-GMP phosphodiesterase class II)